MPARGGRDALWYDTGPKAQSMPHVPWHANAEWHAAAKGGGPAYLNPPMLYHRLQNSQRLSPIGRQLTNRRLVKWR